MKIDLKKSEANIIKSEMVSLESNVQNFGSGRSLTK